MKRERRHELQQNDLLAWVNGVMDTVRPYSKLVLVVLVLAIVGVGGFRWWNARSSTQSAYAWDDLFRAMNSNKPEEVNEVAEQHPGTDVAHWAEVIAGDMYLDTGSQQLFQSKATAALELRKAVEHYLSALEDSQNPAVRERATYGLARAYESLAGTRQSEGELDKATQYYGDVATHWPDGAYAETARRRQEDLQRQATKEFYDKFALYDPQPAYSDQPGRGGEDQDFDLKSLDENTVPDFSKALNLDKEHSGAGEEKGTSGEGDSRAADEASRAEPESDRPASPGEGSTQPAPAAQPAAAHSDETPTQVKPEMPEPDASEPAPAADKPAHD